MKAPTSSLCRQATAPPRHVLVVDDEADACKVIRHALESEGYAVTVETAASCALDRIVSKTYEALREDLCYRLAWCASSCLPSERRITPTTPRLA